MKDSDDVIENRNRDFPSGTAVPVQKLTFVVTSINVS